MRRELSIRIEPAAGIVHAERGVQPVFALYGADSLCNVRGYELGEVHQWALELHKAGHLPDVHLKGISKICGGTFRVVEEVGVNVYSLAFDAAGQEAAVGGEDVAAGGRKGLGVFVALAGVLNQLLVHRDLQLPETSEQQTGPEAGAGPGAEGMLGVVLQHAKVVGGEVEAEKPLDEADFLIGGDAVRGKKIFFRNGSANCQQCHKVGKRGGDAGPNLLGLGARQDASYILESIIVPSAKLAPGYSPIAITMKDGSVVAGMLMTNTDTEVVVRNAETQKDTVCKKTDIANLPQAMSTMPPMGAILKKDQIRDLIAYLSSLKSKK